jgi:hypothetical protein
VRVEIGESDVMRTEIGERYFVKADCLVRAMW